MKKTIIFDIDGTLANLDHRLHYVNDPKRKNWQEFLARVKDDLPIEQTIFLNRVLASLSEFDIVLSSGRSENERADTEEWMVKYGVDYDKMYMRPTGDTRADYIVKGEMLAQMRADGREPWLVFDDRQSVVDMWRSHGLFVLQCAAKETFLDVYRFNEAIQYPLTLMVGPSGAGKTTLLNQMTPASQQSIISSDNLRQSLTGDRNNQEANLKVFETMYELAATRLKLGLPVVLDATHAKTKDRLRAVSLLPAEFKVSYIVVDRSLEDKLKTKGDRTEEQVRRHDMRFKSNLKAILNGDGLPNVTVTDLRTK